MLFSFLGFVSPFFFFVFSPFVGVKGGLLPLPTGTFFLLLVTSCGLQARFINVLDALLRFRFGKNSTLGDRSSQRPSMLSNLLSPCPACFFLPRLVLLPSIQIRLPRRFYMHGQRWRHDLGTMSYGNPAKFCLCIASPLRSLPRPHLQRARRLCAPSPTFSSLDKHISALCSLSKGHRLAASLVNSNVRLRPKGMPSKGCKTKCGAQHQPVMYNGWCLRCVDQARSPPSLSNQRLSKRYLVAASSLCNELTLVCGFCGALVCRRLIQAVKEAGRLCPQLLHFITLSTRQDNIPAHSPTALFSLATY